MPEFREEKNRVTLIREGPTFKISICINSDLSQILMTAGTPQPHPITLVALLDTGSSVTIIQKGKIDKLDLHPIGIQSVRGINDVKPQKHPVFRVGIAFDGVDYFDVSAVVQPLNFKGIDCLLGRDLLYLCKFEYDGKKGNYSISY